MSRIVVGAVALVGLLSFSAVQAQQKLEHKGWGSLVGKVTYDGNPPVPDNLIPRMMIHADKACCLNEKAKPLEKIDQTWIVDAKTKGVANVMVYLKVPAGTYIPTHAKYKNRNDTVVIDQPHCAFLPRVSGYNPSYFDDAGKLVPSGQKLTIKNSASVSHNVRATTNPVFNKPFNENMPPMTESERIFKAQPLPITLQCDVHTWMSARLFVFDHPYYAITKADGSFEIPFVPAGAQIGVAAYHEDVGYLLTKDGKQMVLKEGENRFDFQIKK